MLQNYFDLIDIGIKKLAHLEAGTTTFVEYMEVVKYEFYICGITCLLLFGLVLLFLVPFIAYFIFSIGADALFEKKYPKEWKVAEYCGWWRSTCAEMLKLDLLISDDAECLDKVLTGAYNAFKEMEEKKYVFFSNQLKAKELVFSAYEKYQNAPECATTIAKELYKSLQELKILEEINEVKEKYEELESRASFIAKALTTVATISWVLLVIPLLAML